jgi:hypothetical protein
MESHVVSDSTTGDMSTKAIEIAKDLTSISMIGTIILSMLMLMAKQYH